MVTQAALIPTLDLEVNPQHPHLAIQVRAYLRQEKLAADALRNSEKLANAGRLASSIAHETKNPLEAVTNLRYLICFEEVAGRSKTSSCKSRSRTAACY